MHNCYQAHNTGAGLNMKCLLVFLVQVASFLANGYRLEGEFIIGAIIPITKSEGKSGKCDIANPQGVAIAEAIVHALESISTENEFKSLIAKQSIGYDIRDSCSDPVKVKKHAYDMAMESFRFKSRTSKQKPVNVVLSAFEKGSAAKVLPVLTAENIVQVSYSKDNARLKKDPLVSNDTIKMLISVYPEYTKKVLAIVDLIREFGYNHIFSVASKDYQGEAALSLLSSKIDKYGICMSESLFVSDTSKVKYVVDKIAEYPKIKVVVVHCTQEVELELYKEAKMRNMTNLIFLSTQNWQADINLLSPYAAVVEGMTSVEFEKNTNNFKTYMKSRKLPFTDRKWLKDLFISSGGNASCMERFLKKRDKTNEQCFTAEAKVTEQLLQNVDTSVYAYDSIYSIVFALKKALKDGISLLKATKGLKFQIPMLAMNQIVFTDKLSVETSRFQIYTLRGNEPKTIESKWLGQWDEEIRKGRQLRIRKADMRWKDGSEETPTSVCSESCPPGLKRSYFDVKWKCCWDCESCPNGTVSNVTNSDTCITCSQGEVPHPDQSSCRKYTLLYFKWFGAVGSLIIVLMVVGVALVLFSLAIISQNSTHELVVNANYNSLSFFLLACLLLILTPIPLLIPPTLSSCITYIALFNIAVAMVLGVLVSRSAYINGLFDDNGELVKGTLGGFPRVVVIAIVVVLQVVVTIIAYKMETLQTMHNETGQWDERFHECSSWASLTFWAGFICNMVVSVVGNSMSCSSTKIEDNCFELKYVLISHLMLYLVGIVELCVFFGSTDQHLAGGQGVCCILFAYAFFFCYIWPKIFVILFRSKGDKAIEKPLLHGEEDGDVMTTAIHASAGFKHQGIVQMKIRDEV